MDEQHVRAKVREVLKAGKLPNRRPDRTWGGPGVGAPCAVCDLPVERLQLEFEIQFERDGDNPGPRQVPRPRPLLRGLGV